MHRSTRTALLLSAALLSQAALAQPVSSMAAPQSSSSSMATQPVPEPSSLPLVALGIVGAVVVARFIKRK